MGLARSVIEGSWLLVHVQDVVVFFLSPNAAGVWIGKGLACRIAALVVAAPSVAGAA